MATYLDDTGLQTLWNKIKVEFFRIKDKSISAGSIPYWDVASPSGSPSSVQQPSFLAIPSSDPGKKVLGVVNSKPSWITIGSSLTQTTAASSLSLKVTVLGTDSSALALQVADATHAGIVTADTSNTQTFAGSKKFNDGIVIANNKYLSVVDSNSDSHIAIGMNQQDKFLVGYHMAKDGLPTLIGGQYVYFFTKSTTASPGDNPVLRMTIDPTGNVGIGTAVNDTIASKFQVKGTSTMRNIVPESSSYYLGSSSAYWSRAYLSDVYSAAELGFYIGSTKEIIITGNGLSAIDGGVSANGIADLTAAGGGGGSGTVQKIFIGSDEYNSNQDGEVYLPAYPSDFYTTAQSDNKFATITSLNAVTAKIPAAASSSNQLADKAFVNSSISTATATFRGTVTASADTEAAAATALATITTKDLNDYAFVKVENTPQVGVDKYKRYKYNGTSWDYEYTLNNSSFTSDQWNAINSGATSTIISNIISKTIGTTKGDLITFSAASTPQRLGIGSANQYLGVASGLPSWKSFTTPTVAWTDGGANGPKLAITTDGGTSTAVAIPVARKETQNNVDTYYSGVITTGAQTFVGAKTFDSGIRIENGLSLVLWTSKFQWRTDGDTEAVRKQDLTIGTYFPLSPSQYVYTETVVDPTTQESTTYPLPCFAIYSYENTPTAPSNPSTGVGYMPLMLGGTTEGSKALFYSGNSTYTGATVSYGWGIGKKNPDYVLDVNGTFGARGAASLLSTLSVTGAATLSSTLAVSGNSTLSGHLYMVGKNIYLDNSQYIYAKLKGASASYTNILGLNAAGDNGTLILGYGSTVSEQQVVSHLTRIYGTTVYLHYGSSGATGVTLDSNGDLSVVHNIQSTNGGVAAKGIADLTQGGGGGGTGTVQSLQVNTAPLIIPNTDGKLSLDVALTSGTTNAVSLTIGGSTLNITQSALRNSLGLGAAAYLGTTTSVTSGSGSLITSGGVYSNTVSALGTSGNNLTWTKGGTTTPITVPYATNADTVDGEHVTQFYKYAAAAPMASTADTQDKPWYCVAEYSASNASDAVQSVISFYVFGRYDATSCGILNVKVRFNPSATQPYLLAAEWSAASNITPSDFVATWKVDNGMVTVKLYTRLVGWQYYSFRKINEQYWGYPQNVWTCRIAIYASDYNFASIPSGETQVESTIIGIDNTAANATKLNNQSASYYAAASSLDNYLPLSGGTMTNSIKRNWPNSDTSRYSPVYEFVVPDRAGDGVTNAQIGYHNSGDTDGAIVLLPYVKTYASGGPWSQQDGLYISKTQHLFNGNAVRDASDTYLTLNPDSDATTDDFKLTVGENEVIVAPISANDLALILV